MSENTNENLIVELTNENGETFEVEHLLTFEHERKHYIAFGEVEEDGSCGVAIMKIEEEEGKDDVYLPIEDAILADEVWAVFKELFFDEDDEEEDE